MITFETEDGRTSLTYGDSLFGVSGECVVVARRADGLHDVAVGFRFRRLNSFLVTRDAYITPKGRYFLQGVWVQSDLSDKLRKQVADLKSELKKAKDEHKAHMKSMKVKAAPKAKTARVKMTEEEKGQRKREKAVVKELAKAKQQVQMNPLPAQAEPMMPAPAPSLAPAAGPKGGRTRRRRMR